MAQPGSAQRLWAENSDLARAALGHPFVAGLAEGTLPRATFARFIAQDAYFLESFARAYALALARCPDTAAVLAFADLIGGVRDELRLHGAYASAWDIDMAQVEPAPATRAYTEFLLATAGTAGTDVICAAMVPCMRLYAHLGQSLADRGAGPYVSWIQTYAAPGFETLALNLESLLDAHVTDMTAVRAAYRRAMTLEVSFFDAALDAEA
ncbi:MAG: tenA [Pseudonocardiales bacterium]|nr:tenA [Pseudonocardiales bacterium]